MVASRARHQSPEFHEMDYEGPYFMSEYTVYHLASLTNEHIQKLRSYRWL